MTNEAFWMGFCQWKICGAGRVQSDNKKFEQLVKLFEECVHEEAKQIKGNKQQV